MKQTKLIMGMPITVDLLDKSASISAFKKIFDYFIYIDNKFSTYKATSEITSINKGKIKEKDFSKDMKTVFNLSAITRKETSGYFNINKNGKIDPSGIVKGWAIFNAYKILKKMGFKNFFIDAGGDIQVCGKNKEGKAWRIGIKNPFREDEIVKVVYADNIGVATSGTYIRGNHIYNPKNTNIPKDIISLTVIGPNVFDADRFATAAFAMGKNGIELIEYLHGFEGYMVDKNGVAIMTSGFERYTQQL